MQSRPKIALVECHDYDSPALPDAMNRLLSMVGGLRQHVKSGQTALVKPNLLSDRDPKEGVTTHPEVARAVIRIVKDLGAEPFVADSPSNVTKVERVWEKTGFKSMCAEEDVALVNLEKAGSVRFDTNGFSFNVARPVLDADVIINVPKIKTHVLTMFTGAVKNMYGVVPGFQKAHLHKLHPRAGEFGRLLAEIYTQVPPAFTIADGVVGMDGDGPSGGRVVRMGFLACSDNAVALDIVLCGILGIKPDAVSYLSRLRSAGTGDIQIEGDGVDAIRSRKFKVPSTLWANLVPGPIVRLLQPLLWIRPMFSGECVSCEKCIKVCASDALELDVETHKPLLDSSRCIGCCCCHEVCPEKAVSMAQSPLLNFIRKGRMP